MKKLILVLLCTLTTGCFYQTVNMHDYHMAVRACMDSDNSDVVEIRAWGTGNESVLCFNGKTFNLHDGKVK